MANAMLQVGSCVPIKSDNLRRGFRKFTAVDRFLSGLVVVAFMVVTVGQGAKASVQPNTGGEELLRRMARQWELADQANSPAWNDQYRLSIKKEAWERLSRAVVNHLVHMQETSPRARIDLAAAWHEILEERFETTMKLYVDTYVRRHRPEQGGCASDGSVHCLFHPDLSSEDLPSDGASLVIYLEQGAVEMTHAARQLHIWVLALDPKGEVLRDWPDLRVDETEHIILDQETKTALEDVEKSIVDLMGKAVEAYALDQVIKSRLAGLLSAYQDRCDEESRCDESLERLLEGIGFTEADGKTLKDLMGAASCVMNDIPKDQAVKLGGSPDSFLGEAEAALDPDKLEFCPLAKAPLEERLQAVRDYIQTRDALYQRFREKLQGHLGDPPATNLFDQPVLGTLGYLVPELKKQLPEEMTGGTPCGPPAEAKVEAPVGQQWKLGFDLRPFEDPRTKKPGFYGLFAKLRQETVSYQEGKRCFYLRWAIPGHGSDCPSSSRVCIDAGEAAQWVPRLAKECAEWSAQTDGVPRDLLNLCKEAQRRGWDLVEDGVTETSATTTQSAEYEIVSQRIERDSGTRKWQPVSGVSGVVASLPDDQVKPLLAALGVPRAVGATLKGAEFKLAIDPEDPRKSVVDLLLSIPGEEKVHCHLNDPHRPDAPVALEANCPEFRAKWTIALTKRMKMLTDEWVPVDTLFSSLPLGRCNLNRQDDLWNALRDGKPLTCAMSITMGNLGDWESTARVDMPSLFGSRPLLHVEPQMLDLDRERLKVWVKGELEEWFESLLETLPRSPALSSVDTDESRDWLRERMAAIGIANLRYHPPKPPGRVGIVGGWVTLPLGSDERRVRFKVAFNDGKPRFEIATKALETAFRDALLAEAVAVFRDKGAYGDALKAAEKALAGLDDDRRAFEDRLQAALETQWKQLTTLLASGKHVKIELDTSFWRGKYSVTVMLPPHVTIKNIGLRGIPENWTQAELLDTDGIYFDFSDAEFEVSDELKARLGNSARRLKGEALDIAALLVGAFQFSTEGLDSYLSIVDAFTTRDEVHVALALSLPALKVEELSIGRLVLGVKGLSFVASAEDLEARLLNEVAEILDGTAQTLLGDNFPGARLKTVVAESRLPLCVLGEQFQNGKESCEWNVAMKGAIPIGTEPLALTLPLRANFDKNHMPFPELDVDEGDLVDQLTGGFMKLLGLEGGVSQGPVKVVFRNALIPKGPRDPLGLATDLHLDLEEYAFPGVKGTLEDIRLTTNGLKLPAILRFTIIPPPAYIMVAPFLTFGQLEAIVSLDGSGTFGLAAKWTLLPGSEFVIMAPMEIRFIPDLKKAENTRLTLKGNLVIASAINLFRTEGTLYPGQPKFVMTAQTLPPLRDIAQMDGEVIIDGPLKSMSAKGSAYLFDVRLAEGNFTFNGDSGSIDLKAVWGIPIISRSKIELHTQEGFKDPYGSSSFAYSLGGFTLSGAGVGVSPYRADFSATVLNYKLDLSFPGVHALTPGFLLEVLKSLFQVDLKTLLTLPKKLPDRIEIKLDPFKKKHEEKPTTDGDAKKEPAKIVGPGMESDPALPYTPFQDKRPLGKGDKSNGEPPPADPTAAPTGSGSPPPPPLTAFDDGKTGPSVDQSIPFHCDDQDSECSSTQDILSAPPRLAARLYHGDHLAYSFWGYAGNLPLAEVPKDKNPEDFMSATEIKGGAIKVYRLFEAKSGARFATGHPISEGVWRFLKGQKADGDLNPEGTKLVVLHTYQTTDTGPLCTGCHLNKQTNRNAIVRVPSPGAFDGQPDRDPYQQVNRPFSLVLRWEPSESEPTLYVVDHNAVAPYPEPLQVTLAENHHGSADSEKEKLDVMWLLAEARGMTKAKFVDLLKAELEGPDKPPGSRLLSETDFRILHTAVYVNANERMEMDVHGGVRIPIPLSPPPRRDTDEAARKGGYMFFSTNDPRQGYHLEVLSLDDPVPMAFPEDSLLYQMVRNDPRHGARGLVLGELKRQPVAGKGKADEERKEVNLAWFTEDDPCGEGADNKRVGAGLFEMPGPEDSGRTLIAAGAHDRQVRAVLVAGSLGGVPLSEAGNCDEGGCDFSLTASVIGNTLFGDCTAAKIDDSEDENTNWVWAGDETQGDMKYLAAWIRNQLIVVETSVGSVNEALVRTCDEQAVSDVLARLLDSPHREALIKYLGLSQWDDGRFVPALSKREQGLRFLRFMAEPSPDAYRGLAEVSPILMVKTFCESGEIIDK